MVLRISPLLCLSLIAGLACGTGEQTGPASDNTPPAFTVTPSTTVNHNEPYLLAVTVRDADGDPVTVTAVTIPSWLSFDAGSLALEGTAGTANVGVHDVELRASDGQGSDTLAFAITVIQVNSAPRFTFAPPPVVDHDLDFATVITVEDADGDSVVVTATLLPAWMQFDSDTRLLSGTPGEALLNQTFSVSLQATDGTVSRSFSFGFSIRLGRSRLDYSGPWITQTPHPFGHDSTPDITAHFLVYGAYTSASSRLDAATIFEAEFDTLLIRLGVVRETELEFPPGGRLHMYVDKYQGDRAYGYTSTVNGWAFRDGVIVMANDAPRYQTGGYFPARYSALLTHELMHDMEFLLIGRNVSISASDAWFREGIATYMAGLAPGGVPIESTSWSQLQAWRQQYNGVAPEGNPVAIHTFSDFPSTPPGNNTGAWYIWFAQLIRYLVEPGGFGLGEGALRQIYADLRSGTTFAQSFQTHTGISLTQMENEFWTRMEAFLP